MYRRSQKVGCVSDGFNAPPCVELPKKGFEYTIRDMREADGGLFFLLREIHNDPCICWGCEHEVAFDSAGFRPIVSDEVRNEHVIKIIDDAKRRLSNPHRHVQPTMVENFPPQHFNCRCLP
jgi:hypothetical protein